MKLLTIQIEKSIIRIALVNYKGRRRLIEKLRSFDLPDELSEGRYIADPKGLSDYIAASLEKGRLSFGKAILLLGSSTVIHKEYTHEPVKKSHLSALANLEAESILPENEGEFIVEYSRYGPVKNQKGLEIASIFACSDAFVTNLVNALKRSGIKVVGAYSSLSAYSLLMKELIGADVSGERFSGKTVAALDISYPELRLAVFNEGQLIHQRMDEQIMEEFYRAVSGAYRVPVASAGSILAASGFLEDRGINLDEPKALEQTVQAAGSLFFRLVRSVNITLSSFDLALDHILVTGEGAAFPGFVGFVMESSGIDAESIDDLYPQFSKVLDLEEELSDRKDLYQSLLLSGSMSLKEHKRLNFLTRGLKRKKSARRTRLVCAFILLATIVVMSLLPINYFITLKDRDKNTAFTKTPEYIAAQELLNEQRDIRSRLGEIEAERAKLPFGNSNTARDLKILRERLFNGPVIDMLTYDKETGKYSGQAEVSDLPVFIEAKNSFKNEDGLKVSVPLTLFREGNWYCMFEIETTEKREEGKLDEIN